MQLPLLLQWGVLDAIAAVCVFGGDFGPLVDAVEEGDSHAAGHMGLHVAVEQEGARVDDLVAQGHPGAVLFGGGGGILDREKNVSSRYGTVMSQKRESEGEDETYPVAQRRVDKVKSAGRQSGGCLGHGGPVELAGAFAEHVSLVGVFMHGVRLGERTLGLDDQIDPLAHFGLVKEIGRRQVAGVEVQNGLGVLERHVEGVDAAQGPVVRAVRLAEFLDVELVRHIRRGGRRGGWEGGGLDVVEGDQFGQVDAGKVHAGERVGVLAGWPIRAFVVEDAEAADDLVQAVVGDPDRILRGRLVELDQNRVPVAVVDNHLVHELWGNVAAVHAVHPHLVRVDGELEQFQPARVDEGKRGPALCRVDVEGRHRPAGRSAVKVRVPWHPVDVEREVALRGWQVRRQASLVCDLGRADRGDQRLHFRVGVGRQFLARQAVLRPLTVQDDGVGAGKVNVHGPFEFVQLLGRILVVVGDENGLLVLVGFRHGLDCCGVVADQVEGLV